MHGWALWVSHLDSFVSSSSAGARDSSSSAMYTQRGQASAVYHCAKHCRSDNHSSTATLLQADRLSWCCAGFPSVGKSTLLTKLTGTFSEVSLSGPGWWGRFQGWGWNRSQQWGLGQIPRASLIVWSIRPTSFSQPNQPCDMPQGSMAGTCFNLGSLAT